MSAEQIPAEVTDLPTPYVFSQDLRRFVRDTESDDPRELAELYVKTLPERFLAVVVEELLPEAIRKEFGRERLHSRHAITGEASASPRWSDAGDASKDPRRWRVWVNGEYVRLGLCTVDDLKAVAADYFTRAADLTAWGKRYETLAATLKKAKKSTVAELPDDALAEALS